MMAAAWWDHDSELLGEALSVFANWKEEVDDDGSSSTTSASSDRTTTATVSSSSSRASPLPPRVAVHGPRPVKINRSRERQKQETRQLQQQVIELEEELLRLHTKREKRPRPTTAQAASTSSSSLALIADAPRPGSAAAILAWEKATRRQFRARKKAEMVNARLREMVRTHAGVAQDLVHVIQRAEAARQQAHGTALFPVREPAFTLSAGASNQELQHQLMKISAQWHVPFAQCSKFHDRGEQFFFETTVLRDDGAESLLEIRASMVYPQQRHRMEDELWKYFRTLSCTEDEFSLAMSATEDSDTLLGSLRATVAKDGVLGVLDARFMKQQFRNERGELIIASTTCGRPGLRRTRGPSAEDKELAQVDAVVSEDSWLRVLDADASGSSLTCIQNVRRARIQFGGSDPPDRPKIEAVKKFLARLAENEMRWGSEVVERRLMLGPCNRMPLTA